jgi:glycosyltransferase involved in cell wall biosynthesis
MSNTDPIITVIISTRNRSGMLASTLTSLSEQDFHLPWELLVVDNGSTDETSDVLADFSRRVPTLPMRILQENTPGKSRALNRAVRYARSRLIAFTDDDVLVASDWIRSFVRGAQVFTSASVFCGPIQPLFPIDTPIWMRQHGWAETAFGRFDPQPAEGALPPPALPFGANFCVRTDVLSGMEFRIDLGPAASGLMGEDTEFLRRLRKRQVEFVYLLAARIIHRLRPEQVTLPWLFERAFNFGRTRILDIGKVHYLGVHIPMSLPLLFDTKVHFELGSAINYYCGQAYQLACSRRTAEADILLLHIPKLSEQERSAILAKSANDWMATRRLDLPPASRLSGL